MLLLVSEFMHNLTERSSQIISSWTEIVIRSITVHCLSLNMIPWGQVQWRSQGVPAVAVATIHEGPVIPHNTCFRGAPFLIAWNNLSASLSEGTPLTSAPSPHPVTLQSVKSLPAV